MTEGWCEKDYWALCDDQAEAEHLTLQYGLADYLPGYSIVALKSWDDFVLIDRDGRYYTVPTIPLERAAIAPFRFPMDKMRLQSDPRYTKKIRWFLKPIRFGGDPGAESNTAWIALEEHSEAVKYWNGLYRDIVAKQKKG